LKHPVLGGLVWGVVIAYSTLLTRQGVAVSKNQIVSCSLCELGLLSCKGSVWSGGA
jgi:hypothetical protein